MKITAVRMTQSLPPPKDYPLVHSSLNPQLYFLAPASPPQNVDLLLGATKKIHSTIMINQPTLL